MAIPVVVSLKSDSVQGLYEIYCQDNALFLDLILTFGNGQFIQKFVAGIN